LTELLNDYGDQPTNDKLTRKEALTAKVWELSLAGDMTAIRYIYDRIDGKPLPAQESQKPEGGLRIVLSSEPLDCSNIEVFLGKSTEGESRVELQK
jgi:hypothetical protein